MENSPVKDEITDLLKELDFNIDVDVAYLAGLSPPIKIFPTPNSSHLPYDKQVADLEADYLKYYSYRGDLKYNENMVRSVGRTESPMPATEDGGCMYRVCRDRTRFLETRMKDDVVILSKILDSMVERTAEMEKHLEKILIENGEKDLPNWDELFEEVLAGCLEAERSNETETASEHSTSSSRRSAARKQRNSKSFDDESSSMDESNESSSDQNEAMLTHEEAQSIIAQMMLIGGTHSNGDEVNADGFTLAQPGSSSME